MRNRLLNGLTLMVLFVACFCGATRAWAIERVVAEIEKGRSFQAHDTYTESVAYSRDGNWLVTLHRGKEKDDPRLATLWDVKTLKPQWRKEVGNYDEVVAFHPDGKHVVVGHAFCDIATGRTIREIGPQTNVRRVAFSPNGDLIVVACNRPREAPDRDHGIAVWRLDNRRQLAVMRPKRVLPAGRRSWIGRADWSPDGKWIATVHSADWGSAEFALWDATDFTLVNRFNCHPNRAYSVRFSPDSKWLATGGMEKNVKLWSVEALVPPPADADTIAGLLRQLDDESAQRRVEAERRLTKLQTRALAAVEKTQAATESARVRDACQRIVTAHGKRKIEPKHILKDVPKHLKAIRFSPDGRLIAAGSESLTLLVWKLDQLDKPLLKVKTQSGVLDLAFSPTGETLAVAQRNGKVQFWRINLPRLADANKKPRGQNAPGFARVPNP